MCHICTVFLLKRCKKKKFTSLKIVHKPNINATCCDSGAPGRGEEGAGESEGDVPAGPGEAERVHQSCGEGEGTAGEPEEDQEEDY